MDLSVENCYVCAVLVRHTPWRSCKGLSHISLTGDPSSTLFPTPSHTIFPLSPHSPQAHPLLCTSALLALTKLMAIEAAFCETNMQLFFTLLNNRCGRCGDVCWQGIVWWWRLEGKPSALPLSPFPNNAPPPLPCRNLGAGVRCNLLVALGDLAFRFPNVLEPYTAYMYAPLGDPDLGEGRGGGGRGGEGGGGRKGPHAWVDD